MEFQKIHVGVVGAGAISDIYLKNMTERFADVLQVDAICAAHLESARKKAQKYHIRACTFGEMLADERIEMIVNLTPACAHYDIIKRSLLSGKHVYTEKTMTDELETAAELVELAEKRGLYLGAAPDTFLGAALQTARKAIDDGLIGEVTSCAACANRNNNILLSLFSFLRMPGGGVCYDYAVYYLTALVSLLGPVKRTAAIVRAPYQKHVNILPDSPEYGKEMDTPNESEVSAILQFASGISGTFHLNADTVSDDQAYMAVFGTKGVLYLPDPNQFGGKVEILPETSGGTGTRYALKPVEGFADNSRGLGPAEMALAIRRGTLNRANSALSYHVMEVLAAMLKSGESGSFEQVGSVCERPNPLTEAEIWELTRKGREK